MLLFTYLLVISVSVIGSVVFEDCGSAYDLQTVDIDGCGNSLPCRVTIGDTIPVNLLFRADFEPGTMDQNVVININHVNLRTEVTPELCDHSKCPIRTDGLSTFSSMMSVPRNMALNQRGFLRWRIFNERGRLLLCYSVLVQTQSLTQKLLRMGNNTTPRP